MRRYFGAVAVGLALFAAQQVHGKLVVMPEGGDMETITDKYGQAASRRITAWMNLVKDARKLVTREKLEQVNSFFNRLPNVSDIQQWQVNDYWETPFELLIVNGGDCEDFVIAKYFTLRELGIPEERMRIAYVKAFMSDRSIVSHMVLTYYSCLQCEPLILDNLTDSIQSSSSRKDLVPVYSFQGYDLISSREKKENLVNNTAEKGIPRWDELLQRIEVQEKILEK